MDIAGVDQYLSCLKNNINANRGSQKITRISEDHPNPPAPLATVSSDLFTLCCYMKTHTTLGHCQTTSLGKPILLLVTAALLYYQTNHVTVGHC